MNSRERAYKENPALAMETDFIVQQEAKLKELHNKYKKDTGEEVSFIAFCDFIYHNAQDLVFNPQHN